VAEALRLAAARLAEANVDKPRTTAELLLAYVLERDRTYLIAHPEAALGEEALARFESLVERRAGREPLQYILGRQEFYGREFAVAPGALIPRPETELLVEQALARLRPGDRVCDIGVGSGAIAVTIAAERSDVRVTATDISGLALGIAGRNVLALADKVALIQADLLGPFQDASFDVIVSNPPYVSEADRAGIQKELVFEPDAALYAGMDGLDVYRRLIPEAARKLKPGGSLLMEIGYDSLPGVLELLRGPDWATPEIFEDLAGIPRVVAARLDPS
jgi:release factor glutamine methyltransferase